MRVGFFVQNNQVEKLTVPVAEYAHEHGYVLHDRSSTPEFNVDDCDIDWAQFDVVIPYGSVQFLRQVKASQSLHSYVFHDEKAFSASYWMPIFAGQALNGNGFKLYANEATKTFVSGEVLHLRPDSVDKAFPGGVYDKASWDKTVSERNLDDSLVCWASPLKTIRAEYRCWIVGREVVEISRYRRDDKMDVERETSEEIFTEAQSLADTYLPAQCVVMDMALTDEGFKVIEFNPIHSSGWYGAEVKRVIDRWVTWSARQ